MNILNKICRAVGHWMNLPKLHKPVSDLLEMLPHRITESVHRPYVSISYWTLVGYWLKFPNWYFKAVWHYINFMST